eukprot:5065118-Pleurochrysis_carterae.AAC.1
MATASRAEIAKNKELQETLKGIREDKTLANASAAARQAAASVAGKVQQAGSAAADKASAAADKAAAAAKGAKEGEPQDAKAETGAKVRHASTVLALALIRPLRMPRASRRPMGRRSCRRCTSA